MRYELRGDEKIQAGDRYYFEGAPDLDLPIIPSEKGRTPDQVHEMRAILNGAAGLTRAVFFRETPEPRRA